MAKSKSNARGGQKSITSFFKTPNTTKKKKATTDDDSDAVMEDGGPTSQGEDVSDEEETKPNKAKGKSKRKTEEEPSYSDVSSDEDAPSTKRAKGKSSEKGKEKDNGYLINSDLPPIHDISAIFSDLVQRIPKIKPVAEYLSGRKLRVATMCSGTESPLLALELIRRSMLEHYNIGFDFQHVFSCEIEPFKQAYIERNFSPPLLFRDVCELGDPTATTAYGAEAPVPGDVDMLIAGTSCVDYSNLNNKKQGIDAKGESGETFRGMMSWVQKHRPPIVILENVCSAPWDKVVKYFQQHDYSAKFLRVDTKNYYIPHTRTRVYLLAVDQANSSLPEKWKVELDKLKRPASSTLDAFLLPTDDPRVHQARQKLVQESSNNPEHQRARMDWGRCESRHQRARLDDELGSKRPLTSWEEGGFCKMLDFCWNDWGIAQVERVWDLMDITLLRSAMKGVDPSYKTLVWNLSQNVDRSIGSSKVGICPCLTPSMIPYITNRGGPMTGVEALSMQGLPVDELLLTRETESQLADLAGNAMSTTVVGACMLAALVIGKGLLKSGEEEMTYEKKKDLEENEVDDIVLDVDAIQLDDQTPIEEHIAGENLLVSKPLDLTVTSSSSSTLETLLRDASKSIRLCECEGRKQITDREIRYCKDCGSSSCVRCGGRPEHNLETYDVVANPRIPPTQFEKELKSILPMSLVLAGVTAELLDSLKASDLPGFDRTKWNGWKEAVLRGSKEELRFVEAKRQEIWIVTYRSSSGYLELLLHPQQPEWRLFITPLPSEPSNSSVRKMLEEHPVGRFNCKDGLFKGKWEFALPVIQKVDIEIEGVGEKVPSWEARLGLQGADFKDKLIFPQLSISIPSESNRKIFDRDISGTYTLLDRCGTANSALHKRERREGETEGPDIFMLLDPSRCGDPKDDGFVFSISKKRYEYGEIRPVICTLDPHWRQSDKEGTQSVRAFIPAVWVESSSVKFKPAETLNATFATPDASFSVDASEDSCRSACALLVCHVPLNDQSGPEWPHDHWVEIDKVHERGTFKALAWLTERIKNEDDHFREWQHADIPEHLHNGGNCERCAPSAPEMKWCLKGKKVVAIEDTVQAGKYERALKSRPAPFITQLKLDKDGIGTVRIGINIASLMHRALSRLPCTGPGRTEEASLSWRLQTDFFPIAKLQLPKFKLSSNRSDPEHKQPPNFKLDLRPEQLRSLTWMLAQEDVKAPPFMEEEISEAVLEPLGWRAEGRAQRPIHIRGGVLADEVGYGKTAITLGLIDCTAKEVHRQYSKLGASSLKGKISTKATLVIVPPHLTKQWASEVKKFFKSVPNVVEISTVANLNSVTIKMIQEADIVVIACNIFKSGVYLENLQTLAASGELPNQEGRFFNARLDIALDRLGGQVETLKKEGSEAVWNKISEASSKNFENEYFVPTKRLKGKSFREQAEAKQKVQTSKQQRKPTLKAKAIHGLIPEVVIPYHKTTSVATSSGAEDDMDEDDDSGPRRKRRVAKKPVIILSDDDEAAQDDGSDFEPVDEDDDKPVPKSKKSAPKKSRSKKSKASESSDYDDSSAEETEDEEDAVMSSEEENTKKGKRKSKAIPKAKLSAKRKATSSESEDVMDIDDDDDKPKAKGKGKKSNANAKGSSSKKRKSSEEPIEDEDTKPPVKKQKRREDKDPWGLRGAAKKNWIHMKAPPFEMFHFARKVVDEYTYLSGKPLAMVTRITADRQWVLSGTPPIHDFLALKTISNFLGIHLGVDDDGEGRASSQDLKKRQRDMSSSEKFHSFREVHTLEWHAHRHEIGQTFLDQFVRQNIAEIDEIPCSTQIEKIILPAAERAIYLELEHHLRALDMTIKRSKKSESDREKRLQFALGSSGSAEEALLKRCSHFDLDTSQQENATKACEVIVKGRKEQLEDCKKELLKKIKDALSMEKKIGKTPDESLFREHIRVCYTEGIGDKDATDLVIEILQKAGVESASNPFRTKNKDTQLTTDQKDKMWELREHTHEIRRITKELVGRVRSLRYFTVVRDLQKQHETAPVVSCPGCQRESIPMEEIAVLSSCGHMGCLTCVTASADKEECIYAESGECRAAARVLNIVRGSTLGVDEEKHRKGRHYGLKLEKIIDLISNRISKKDRVLVFVQFDDLMKKVAQAFTDHKIKFLQIQGTAISKANSLTKFQENSEERVLLLTVMDESASGANLTSANHAIFISPLLAPTQEIYDACETQAIGRLRRYGQTKHVNIYRFLSMDTIDVEIYEKRTKSKVE
ncbi:hypothetical protein ABKN59_011208 [Abortiporus biennis]